MRSKEITRRTGRAAAVAGAVALAFAAAAPSAPAARPGVTPLELPGASAARSGDAGGGWLVAGRPGPATREIAARFEARPIMPGQGVFSVRRARARAFAAALRRAGRLRFAERDPSYATAAFPTDPLSGFQWWLRAVAPRTLTPPRVTSASPRLGVIDAQIDRIHPEFAGANVTATSTSALTIDHGTAVTAVAAAPDNGRGIVGLWPGMRVLHVATRLTCSAAAAAIDRAGRAGVSVLNLSFAGPYCFTLELATNVATGRDIVVVAAGGNELASGNRVLFPASSPHVLTVAAVDRAKRSAFFSNRNEGIDLAAPGVGVLTAVPGAADNDGNRNGYTLKSGTSFSAPMVAAAAAWVRARRPGLSNNQVARVLNFSTRDLGRRGWDQAHGYGLLDLRAALRRTAPRHDPGEPNDDIRYVNGSIFARPDAFLFRASQRVRSVAGSVDQWEDPADVYRVRLAGKSTVRLRLRPTFGDPDLRVYSASARSIFTRGGFTNQGLIDASTRIEGRLDSSVVTNQHRNPRTVHVAIGVDPSLRDLDAGYSLEVRRIAYEAVP